ncbi:hypothetical protein EDB19DRAFT_1916808 [Suillus lakei]|nr:hypothetical protein EDB19DRAFT_1916808 [Suillus lakei]
MLPVTPLPPAAPCASLIPCTYCSSSHSPPLPRKKKTHHAGHRIRAAQARAYSTPSVPLPPVHSVSLLTVDTPTPLPAPPRLPSLPLPDPAPLTEDTLHPILQSVIFKIMDEKVIWTGDGCHLQTPWHLFLEDG